MAWQYGNIRWQLPFASVSNVNCRVDIYQRGYTGSTISELTGAQIPIYWDEDNDESLLNVVRTKTGYLKVIEQAYNELSELYPANDTDHYIEVFYGSDCVFSGFMQAQSFDLPFKPAPRTLNLPINSPLVVSEGLKMPVCNPPEYRSIGTILKDVCTNIPANITQIIFPVELPLDTNYTAGLSWKVLSLSYCPYNSEFDNYKEHTQDVFIPKYISEVIEGICNCFGLIVHDYPGMLIFTKVDYTGQYGVYNVATLGNTTPTPVSTIDSSVVTDYSSIQILSNKGKEKSILPLNKLSINYDGDFEKTGEVKFERSKYNIWNQIQGQKNVTLKNYDPAYHTPFENDWYFPTDDLTPPQYGEDWKHGMWFAKYGNSSLSEKLLWRAPNGIPSYATIFEWKLFAIPPRLTSYKYTFTMRVERGDSAYNLSQVAGITFGIIIRKGNLYWDGSDWVNTPTYLNVTTDSEGMINYTFTMIYSVKLLPERFTISFNAGDMSSPTYMYAFTDMKFGSTEAQEIFDVVIPEPERKKDIIENNGSNISDSISQIFNTNTDNWNQVMSPTDGRESIGMATDYSYLFTSRLMHRIHSLLPRSAEIYLQRVKFFSTDAKKKIISCGFTPSEDKMDITLQTINTL